MTDRPEARPVSGLPFEEEAMPKLAVLARNFAVAGVLAGVLGGCAVYVPGPPPGPGYYRGYYAPTPHYYHYGYYGRPYFRRG